MNIYQKLAFGVVAVLVVAYSAAAAIDHANVIVTLAAFVIALLTLRTTWKVILGLIQLIGATIAVAGHTFGNIGDMIADFAFSKRKRLNGVTLRRVGRRVERPASPDNESSESFIESTLQPTH